MCGIAGWVGHFDKGHLEVMTRSLAHRGPDESGSWYGPSAALGIARLSIVDVSNGHQPVFSSDRTIISVFNGEIYNYPELAEEITADGVILRSASDSEVIPHLYQRYGLEFVHRLRGMFAIALWDNQEKQLVLVRDRVGKKPLVYAIDNGEVLFASEARALLALGWRSPVDLASLDHVLAFGYLPEDAGAFEGLKVLPPGHVGVFKEGHLETRSYWTWNSRSMVEEPHSDRTWIERIEIALDESVNIRSRSERPVGSFLSGGIDSTIITAMLARRHRSRLKTFSVGFPDRQYDESIFARAVANYLGTEHFELMVDTDPADLLERYARAFDQPFADSSAIPTLLLSELAARDVVVALSGDGGDEAFGGYDRYRAVPLLQNINFLLRGAKPVRVSMVSLADKTGRRRLGRLARQVEAAPSLGARYMRVMELIPASMRTRLWTAEAQQSFSVNAASERFAGKWASTYNKNALNSMRAMDMASYLPGDLLTKVDTASMSCSLEVRSPFLDQGVLSLAASLPSEMLIRRGVTKWILREIAYQLVPRHLVDRPKRGFGIPQAAWLRGPLRELSRDLLLDNTARQRGWFAPDVVANMMQAHDSGRDHDRIIWPILMMELWARQWLDKGTLLHEKLRL